MYLRQCMIIIIYRNITQLTQNVEIAEQIVIIDDNLSKFRC